MNTDTPPNAPNLDPADDTVQAETAPTELQDTPAAPEPTDTPQAVAEPPAPVEPTDDAPADQPAEPEVAEPEAPDAEVAEPEADVTEAPATEAPEAEAATEAPEAEASEAPEAEASEAPEAETHDRDATATDGDDRGPRRQRRPGPDVGRELEQLMEFATRYTEIGPVVAELAARLGYDRISERILNMGLDSDEESLDYHFVAARLARKEGEGDRVLNQVSDALRDFTAEYLAQGAIEDEGEILHLVRLGFSTMLFDMGGVNAAPEFTALLAEEMPKLRPIFEQDAFYHSLLAQALWFTDREASEQAWDHAVTLADPETTWNARGTWYKEAELDVAKAESAYRNGIQDVPQSALPLHNLAQLLMDRAAAVVAEDHEAARRGLEEAHRLLRRGLRASPRPRLKRYIFDTLDRLKAQQRDLPEPAQPKIGDIVHGRVRTLKPYGAFLDFGAGYSGLLHVTELAHEHVDDPGSIIRIGDRIKVQIIELEPRQDAGGFRISLSRRSLLPAPGGNAEPAARIGDEAPAPSPEEGGEDQPARRRRSRGRGRGRGRGGAGGESGEGQSAAPAGEGAPQGDQPAGERPPRDEQPRGDRPPRTDQPRGDRPPRTDQPRGDRPPRTDQPRGDQPRGDQPRGDRPPRNDQPRGDRPPRTDQPRGDRPPRNDQPRGDRPPRNDRPRSDRPPRDDRPRGDRQDKGPKPEQSLGTFADLFATKLNKDDE